MLYLNRNNIRTICERAIRISKHKDGKETSVKRIVWMAAVGVVMFLINGCGGGASSSSYGADGSISRDYRFSASTEGWQGGFADYPVGEEAAYELRFAYTRLPAPLDESEGALLLSGVNHSDDLFMYVKRPIFGLDANRTYEVHMRVTFASNVPDGSVGIGGSPGEGVTIKAGASGYEPKAVADESGRYRMNIDKGNQSTGGTQMIVVGDFSNDTDLAQYALKTVATPRPVDVTADDNGTVWLIVGADSGFEGKTTLYIDRIEATLAPVSE